MSNISSTEVSDGGIHVKEGSIEFNLTPIKTERTKSKASPERMDGDNKNSLNIELRYSWDALIFDVTLKYDTLT